MIAFEWQRLGSGKRGVTWWLRYQGNVIGRCFYLPGSRHYICRASVPQPGGMILTEYYGGTAASARRALEREWCKRSIGLFGEDDIDFMVML